LAQITPDGTLGSENSTVTLTGAVDRINGGATRGANLFHSFQEFNVGRGRGVYFTNPAGIENILSRVTGANPSSILGTLGVTGGNANLFLINPHGIIFGPNARLDVRGSFVGTTANAIGLANGDVFNAKAGERLPNQLLNVNPNAFLFNQIATQPAYSIENQGSLSVPNTQSLLLVGGNTSPNASSTGGVLIDGGTLLAPGGRVELGGIAELGTVGLEVDGNNLGLSFPDSVARASVSLTKGALVDVSGEGGGDIQIQGQRVTVADGSQVMAKTLGPNLGGSLTVTATDSVEVIGEALDGEDYSRLTTRTEGAGAAGDMTINTEKLLIQDGAQVSAGTVAGSTGRGGKLTVIADLVEVSGASKDGEVLSRLTTRTEGAKDAGDMIINTKKLLIQDGGQVSAGTSGPTSTGDGGTLTITASDSVEVSGESSNGEEFSRLTTRTEGTGDAGDLTINTRELLIQNGAQVSTGALAGSTGDGGTLTVTASNLVEVSGLVQAPNDSISSRLTTRTEGTGDAGDLTINTRELLIQNGAQVSTGALAGSTGDGGTLTVTASNLVEVSGLVEVSSLVTIPGDTDTVSSRLTTRTEGTGDGGDMTINTKKLLIQSGAQVSTGTQYFTPESTGTGGNLTVNASDSVEVSGSVATKLYGTVISSRLTSRTETSGNGGNLRITTGKLVIRDRAEVGVNSRLGSGEAANLEVVARSILLDNNATLNARAASVNGGNTTLQVQDLLLLRNNSQVSATAGTAQARGDGGNITIDTDNLVALENSDITANAFQGRGGQVEIAAQGLFGTEFRDRQTSESDITASSAQGPQFSGTVEINTPDVDPSSGLVALPEEVVDASGLVAQRCPAGRGNVARESSEFVVTGRGGLPPSPSDPPSSDTVLVGWITLNPEEETRSDPAPATNPTIQTPAPLVEAQGWVKNSKGQVALTAQAPIAIYHSPGLTPASCDGF